MPEPRPATWQDLIRTEAKAANVPESLALALSEQESAFNPAAVSPKGAIGLMQLMPSTAKDLGVDPHDPIQNIRGGVRYLRQQLDAFGGDVQRALGAYNAGPAGVPQAGYVEGVLGRLARHASSAPPVTADAGQGLATKPRLPDLPSLASVKPGAPPAPSSFERTPAQSAVEGMRKWSVLPMAGSMVGGGIGAGAGLPTLAGVPVGAVAGAGAGAVIGERAQLGLEKLVGLPDAGPPVPRMLREGAAGAVGEGAGTLIAKGISKVAAPFAKKVTVEGLEALRSMKGKVLPAQATDSRILDIGQNIAEASLFGGGGIKTFKEGQDKIVESLVDNAIARYGGKTSAEDAGQAFVQGLEGNIDTFHQYASTLYKTLDAHAAGVQVPTQGLKDWAAQELERRSAVPALSGDSSLSILKGIVALPDTVPFSQASVLRSQALAKGRSLLDPDRDVLRGITEQITKHIDSSMEQAATQAGPQVAQAFRTANDFYKAGKAQFETKFLRGLVEARPDEVAKALLRNNSPNTIREARAAVPASAWKPVQASLATTLVEKATNVETGQINGKAMLTQIKGLGASFKEVFPQTADEVKRLARVISTVQEKQGEGTGRMYIQLAQAGATVGFLTGAAIHDPKTMAASGVILLGPAALAKILTSPQGIRWLTTGLTPGVKTAVASRAAANLASFLSAGEAPSGPPAPTPRGTLVPSQALRDIAAAGPPPPPRALQAGAPPRLAIAH